MCLRYTNIENRIIEDMSRLENKKIVGYIMPDAIKSFDTCGLYIRSKKNIVYSSTVEVTTSEKSLRGELEY